MGGEGKKSFDESLDELIALVGPKLPQTEFYSKAWVSRFLTARNQNVKKASEMLLESLAWRKKHNVDNILSTEPDPRIAQYLPHAMLGLTPEGHHVYMERSGRVCFPGNDVLPMDALFHWKVWTSEKLDQVSRNTPSCTGRTIAVLDADGLTLSTMTPQVMAFLKLIGEIDEKNYPESLEKVLVLNAGFVFSNVWAMIKYFFAAEVRKKIVVLNDSYEKELYKLVPPAMMPTFLKGGKNTAVAGEEWAGDLAYMSTLPQSAAHVGLESKEVVPAGKTFTKKISVTQKQSAVTWSFVTEAKSIEFSVHSPSGAVIKPSRIDPGSAPHTGTHMAVETGEYKVVFCNKFSWTTDKTVRYNISIAQPNGED
eukprot:TRINITY_DN30503_c0_g3_i1.p1 TRINITY_DN30503_c0_g3~~TRINITY_DN30503_c0_g3_i1.p1  ORF type:complete len:367 (+),score=139.43 TRINITY_DN30503_c0_g3_i1:134-1234(+)